MWMLKNDEFWNDAVCVRCDSKRCKRLNLQVVFKKLEMGKLLDLMFVNWCP